MNRAYAILTVKAVEEDKRIIRGTATTPSPDRVGDIVEPLGVEFKNPMPLLHQHDSRAPVGTVRFDKPTKSGITFEARLPTITEPGALKDRVDTAWGEVKAGLVSAVSIGFSPLEYSRMEDGGYRYIRSEVLELSLVTVPANADCTISLVKSLDLAQRAASGQPPDDIEPKPPAPGKSRTTPVIKAQEAKVMKKTIAEQIAAFEATLTAKSVSMDTIMDTAAEAGVTLDAAQKEEYDTLADEVKEIGEHIVRLKAREESNKKSAVAIDGTTPQRGTESRSGVTVLSVKSNLPAGTAFTRYAMALALGKGNLMQSAEIAKGWHDSPLGGRSAIRRRRERLVPFDRSQARPAGSVFRSTPVMTRPTMQGGSSSGRRPIVLRKVPTSAGASVKGVAPNTLAQPRSRSSTRPIGFRKNPFSRP
ncbi:HK97 family phage prohead protease [Tardiphaga sp.]|uniref:HK97 family phage prohead protease n=1 Tax=Tardiphaga sp. TaxID=1926292 RepID=UPI0026293647|nr:HK97 family phage prohead protease [Tardiphaga sp.]MDB5618217.1 peptidase phage prohead [Tardiphaga sp.]